MFVVEKTDTYVLLLLQLVLEMCGPVGFSRSALSFREEHGSTETICFGSPDLLEQGNNGLGKSYHKFT